MCLERKREGDCSYYNNLQNRFDGHESCLYEGKYKDVSSE
jgi:hypothetical protein